MDGQGSESVLGSDFPCPSVSGAEMTHPVGKVVFDLSTLNRFVVTQRFEIVTRSQVRLHLQPGTWMGSLDLKYAYWNVPIHPQYLTFLAFQLEQRTLQFTVLPFGTSGVDVARAGGASTLAGVGVLM